MTAYSRHRDFDVDAMRELARAANNPESALLAYEQELEKISGIFGAIGQGISRFGAGLTGAGAALGTGIGNFGKSIGGGLTRAVDAVSPGVTKARAAWHGVGEDVLRQADADVLAKNTKLTQDLAEQKSRANAQAYRAKLGLPPEPAAGAAAAGAADPNSFLNSNFGLNQLQAPAGSAPGAGLQNWWQNTTDAQKLKTLGAAGLGTVGLGLGTMAVSNMAGGRPQINMGPTVTGY